MRRLCLILAVGIAVPQLVYATAPTLGELAESRRWAAGAFEGVREEVKNAVGLQVLANNDSVQWNSRSGKPLCIADKQFARGLYCHAVSKVLVRLPGAAKEFSAIVGVDSNDQTKIGRGSVVFSVVVGGKTAFQSQVLREGMAGVPVQVGLGGAAEFVLNVSDGGDGISSDQADWADAKVVLADGKTVWLGELPEIGGQLNYGFEPMFSFTYGGKPSAELLKTWELKRGKRQLDADRTEHTLTYTDPKTGLVLRCVGIEYLDFPTVEWTLYFKNTSDKDTPILSDIRALDVALTSPGEPRVRYALGSSGAQKDYQPLESAITPGATVRLSAGGGRPSSGILPYFNLEMPGNNGAIVVVGWPGFGTRNSFATKRITCGFSHTRKLRTSSCCRARKCARRWSCCSSGRATLFARRTSGDAG